LIQTKTYINFLNFIKNENAAEGVVKANDDNKLNQKRKVNLRFMFVSLISPFFVQNVSFFKQLSKDNKKVWLKQSYLLLTWFYHISFLESKKKTKNRIMFFVFPIRLRKFTLTKAPIAHKNWSKEQYQTKFYKFKISYTSRLNENFHVNSVNAGLLFALISKKDFPIFETNVLFLKYYQFFFFLSDTSYFNYYKFINKKTS